MKFVKKRLYPSFVVSKLTTRAKYIRPTASVNGERTGYRFEVILPSGKTHGLVFRTSDAYSLIPDKWYKLEFNARIKPHRESFDGLFLEGAWDTTEQTAAADILLEEIDTLKFHNVVDCKKTKVVQFKLKNGEIGFFRCTEEESKTLSEAYENKKVNNIQVNFCTNSILLERPLNNNESIEANTSNFFMNEVTKIADDYKRYPMFYNFFKFKAYD